MIKVAIIGCGKIAQVRHLPEYAANPNVELVGYYDLNRERAEKVAAQYGVSYPTVRLRLDRLIQKIQLGEQIENEPYIALIKRLAVDDKLDFDTAKILISEYRKQLKQGE